MYETKGARGEDPGSELGTRLSIVCMKRMAFSLPKRRVHDLTNPVQEKTEKHTTTKKSRKREAKNEIVPIPFQCRPLGGCFDADPWR